MILIPLFVQIIAKMKKVIAKWIFEHLMGWKIKGEIQNEIKKCVIIVMPHTSWHDFYIAIICRAAIGLDIKWLGKEELFRFPFTFFFRALGGVPLDRRGGQNKVEAIVNLFNNNESLWLGISPEGTRKKVTQLRTGFYYIALKAQVPIVPVSLNFEKREVVFGNGFYPGGDLEADLKDLNRYFIDAKGKIPENAYQYKENANR